MPRRLHADSWRSCAIPAVQAALECLVLALALLSPWAFGAETQGFLFWLYAGLGGVLLLWAARVLLDGRWSWQGDGISACLAGLFLVSVFQTITLPPPLLAWLSPRAVALNAQLRPTEPELLPAGAPRLTAPGAASGTISLYPARTREEAVKLLAVFLLFAAVRHNLGSTAALGRLSLLATVNGSLLSLFGLVQFFSTPSPQLVYWTYPSDGAVFGPFVCRNHFPFYVNICAGLCVGQMVAWQRLQAAREERAGWFVDRSGWRAPLRLLHDPPLLWLSIALALMVTATLFSMSRGGTLSLLGSAGVCLAVKLTRSRRVSHLETAGLIALLVLGLATWFGFDAVQERLATLWRGTALEDGRVTYFQYGLRLWRDFPLLGTGLGTWAQVEPLLRAPGEHPWMISVHAHNDYIEALVEGGIIRFGLSMLAIVLVYRQAWHNLRRYRKRFEGGLVLGGLFGFTTVVLHSIVDFGLHVPAIAVLAAVLAAQLSARRQRRRRHPRAQEIGRWVPVGAAATLALLAVFLVTHGLSAARREGYRLTALNLTDPGNPAAVEQQRLYLEAAVRTDPAHAHVNIEYAEALLARHQQALAALAPDSRALQGAAAVLAAAPTAGDQPGGASAAVAALARVLMDRPPIDPAVRAELDQRYLTPALAHCLLARDLCPLLPEAQLWLAARINDFERADPRVAYLRRATIARPENPEFWYLLGDQQYRDGDQASAWASWQQSLRGSDRYLPQILARCRDVLTTEEIIARVLPADPERLLAAALALHPPPAPLALRQPLLEKALALLEAPGERPERQRLRGRVLQALGRPAEALAAYATAVRLAPDRTAWRFELAQLLYQQGQLAEARDQLLLLMTAQPGHAEGRALLDAVQRELVEHK